MRWGLLYGFVLIALLSHLLLDWTNNYGLRPFFPFNAHWYAGSIMFIFEPVLFAVLLAALIAPALFALIGGEVGARRETFRGRGWAIFALAAMVVLWGWRELEHDTAVQMASTASYGPTATMLDAASAPVTPAQVLRVTASPYPGNPYRWHTVVETPQYYQMATVDTLRSTVVTDSEQACFTSRLRRWRSWWLSGAGWARCTWTGQAGRWLPRWDRRCRLARPAGTPDWTAVRFMDLRFLYDTPMMRGGSGPPLSGMVYVDKDGRVARMELGGHVQR